MRFLFYFYYLLFWRRGKGGRISEQPVNGANFSVDPRLLCFSRLGKKNRERKNDRGRF